MGRRGATVFILVYILTFLHLVHFLEQRLFKTNCMQKLLSGEFNCEYFLFFIPIFWNFVDEILKFRLQQCAQWRISVDFYICIPYSYKFSLGQILARIYFRAPWTKHQNSVLIFAQFRANILLKQHFYTIDFFKIWNLKIFARINFRTPA